MNARTASHERTLKMTRTITKAEQPWMDEGDEVKEGEIVYPYLGCTYGCLGAGIAVSRKRGQTPFFEVPADAVQEVEDNG